MTGHIFAVSIITACYLIFAAQLVIFAGRDLIRTKGARAIMALVCVFILCALAGYVSDLIGAPRVRAALHWALVAASLWLVLSNQARAVARILAPDFKRRRDIGGTCDS